MAHPKLYVSFRAVSVSLCIDLVRIKTDAPYITFMGKFALGFLDKYLKTRGKLRSEDRLFALSQRTINYRFKRASERMLEKFNGRNPCSPHSLRAAFRTLLGNCACLILGLHVAIS
jgi:site-specific recombinase XerD